MDALERSEKRAKIDGDIRYCHVAEVSPKVAVAEVGKNCHDLVCMAERCDQRAD